MEIAGIDLWLPKEDKVGFEIVGEVFEVKDISTETFDIPGEYRKGCKGRSSR